MPEEQAFFKNFKLGMTLNGALDRTEKVSEFIREIRYRSVLLTVAGTIIFAVGIMMELYPKEDFLVLSTLIKIVLYVVGVVIFVWAFISYRTLRIAEFSQKRLASDVKNSACLGEDILLAFQICGTGTETSENLINAKNIFKSSLGSLQHIFNVLCENEYDALYSKLVCLEGLHKHLLANSVHNSWAYNSRLELYSAMEVCEVAGRIVAKEHSAIMSDL